MAGDWIKMRADLFTHPKVVRMMSALKADKFRTVGGLMSVWCLFDVHSEDGRLLGYTIEALDEIAAWPGFSAAMMSVSWLEVDEHGVPSLPRFSHHNGQSAKRRAQDSERKREARGVRKVSALDADETRTREEKRREEEKNREIARAQELATIGGSACRAMRDAGVPAERLNPMHAELLAAIESGATPAEFGATAAELLASGKPANMAYIIRTVMSRREASASNVTKLPVQPPPEPIKASHRPLGSPRG